MPAGLCPSFWALSADGGEAMKYTVYDTAVSQDKRQEANEKLLYLIDSGKAENYGISSDDIYNLYTGDGGLHGLRQQDHDNYASYS